MQLTAYLLAAIITGHAQVVDGDTLNIGPVRIRLHGIDAPEAGQQCARRGGGAWDCGTVATYTLAAVVADDPIKCDALDQDPYGRIIARCMVNGRDLSEAMISEGLAWAYREYSDDYAALEDRMSATGIGIWQAASEPPWQYRANRWARAAAESPYPGCPIKGNISRNGERIYHTPWSPAYSRTKIDEGNGERWFCDEAEAVSAGWRPARWH